MDKAGEKYWSKVWQNTNLPYELDVKSKNVNNYAVRRFHNYFKGLFSSKETKGKKLLEIGCGNSVWLPYFAKEFKFEVSGLDYSPIGCETSEKILERASVKGKVYCSDFFLPPEELIGQFDVVVSFGVAEHFKETSEVLKSFAKFLKPGGMLITEIPNMSGAIGFLHKILNRPVYDIHVPLDLKQLNKAHKQAELEVIDSRYMISSSFHINLEGKDKLIPFYKLKKKFIYLLASFPKIIWFCESYLGSLPETKPFSPIIFATAIKKA